MKEFAYSFSIPEAKKLRILIDTDCKNEADDQFALVHALLTPRFRIRGVIAAHFGTGTCTDSMQRSYEEILRVMDLMDVHAPAFCGAAHALPDERTPVVSVGSEKIISEAMADDPSPLYILNWGPLTDMASALLQCPEIAGKIHIIWIGGSTYPQGGGEFNLNNDIFAANVVMRSGARIQMVTMPGFARVYVGFAELQRRVSRCGKIGAYLYRQLLEYVDTRGDGAGQIPVPMELAEGWCLGDSASLSLLLNPQAYARKRYPAPQFTENADYIPDTGLPEIEIVQDIDARFLLEDFFSKLELNYPPQLSPERISE